MSDTLIDVFGEDMIGSDEQMKPFHKVFKKSNEELLKWLNQAFESLVEQGATRTRQQRENLLHYRGVNFRLQHRDRNRDNRGRRLDKLQRFVVNHLHDLTETKVSQMNRLKPNVEVVPTNSEWSDRSSAKVVNFLIKHIWDVNNIDYIVQKQHRSTRIFGESFIFIDWDEDAGDLHPIWVEARAAGIEEVQLPDGRIFKIDENNPLKTGDITYNLEVPWRVLLQRKLAYEDSEYLFRVGIEPTEDLKKKYPGKKIKSTEELAFFDIEDLKDKFLEEHTLIVDFWHKHTNNINKGAYIRFTKDSILEKNDHKFTHGELPCVRLTDLDVPEVLNGVSKYEQIIPLQNMHSNLSTLIAKNIYLMAHAKWLMPRGAAKLEQLGSDNTIVQFQGPVAPQMAQVAPNPAEVYAFRDSVKAEMQVIYGSHGISRGEVPKGITAASALQFLNELEAERATTDIAKHGFMVKDLAKMTIAVAGDKYHIDDGRMMRIVGENNKFLIKHFDTSNLNKNYDVRFDLSSGLPETKAARYQRILDAMQRNPSMVSSARWEALLELGDTEKLSSLTTEAIKSADSENEDLLAGREVALPEEWEDHIAHWDSHSKQMQSRSFKEEATEEVRQIFKEHLFWTEEAMMEKAKISQLFQAKLASLELFPIFYHEGFSAPASREHQAAMVQGQANRGDEVTGSIPGIPSEEIEAQKRLLQDNKIKR